VSHSPLKCPGKMPNHNTIILNEAECISGVSQEHLQQAHELFSKSGFLTVQNIWVPRCSQEIVGRTTNVLSSLPQEDGYIQVKRRSTLPQEIANNKVRSIPETLEISSSSKLLGYNFHCAGLFPSSQIASNIRTKCHEIRRSIYQR
jgi:hypothetical protein